jgi:hypothetical protein
MEVAVIGALAGDIIGSIYEFDNYQRTDFPLFGLFAASRSEFVPEPEPRDQGEVLVECHEDRAGFQQVAHIGERPIEAFQGTEFDTS